MTSAIATAALGTLRPRARPRRRARPGPRGGRQRPRRRRLRPRARPRQRARPGRRRSRRRRWRPCDREARRRWRPRTRPRQRAGPVIVAAATELGTVRRPRHRPRHRDHHHGHRARARVRSPPRRSTRGSSSPALPAVGPAITAATFAAGAALDHGPTSPPALTRSPLRRCWVLPSTPAPHSTTSAPPAPRSLAARWSPSSSSDLVGAGALGLGGRHTLVAELELGLVGTSAEHDAGRVQRRDEFTQQRGVEPLGNSYRAARSDTADLMRKCGTDLSRDADARDRRLGSPPTSDLQPAPAARRLVADDCRIVRVATNASATRWTRRGNSLPLWATRAGHGDPARATGVTGVTGVTAATTTIIATASAVVLFNREIVPVEVRTLAYVSAEGTRAATTSPEHSCHDNNCQSRRQ